MKLGGPPVAPARRATTPAAGTEPRLRSALHHGARLLLLLAMAVAVHFLFPGARISDSAVLERGMVAREDVIAEFSFPVLKTPEELEREQAEAASGVPPVYDYVPERADEVLARVSGFFAAVDSVLALPPDSASEADPRARIARVLDRTGVQTTVGIQEALLNEPRRDALEAAVRGAVQGLLREGVAPPELAQDGVSAVRVRGEGEERLVSADSLMTPSGFFRVAGESLPAALGPDAAELQRLLLARFFLPTYVLNARATEQARARARSAVDSVKTTVLRGEKIVGAREQVGPREEERLHAYQAALQRRGERPDSVFTARRALGAILYDFLLLGVLGLLLLFSRRRLYDDARTVGFLAFLVISVVGAAAMIARADFPPELIPVPFAVLTAAVLWGGRVALPLALVLALLLGGQSPFLGLTVPATAALGGAAAAFGVRIARRRLQTWVLIGLIWLTYAAAGLAVGLLRADGWGEIGMAVLWGGVNAIGSSLLALGILPLAEWVTRVTTNLTLMELADPNQPLLRRLALEAPGTYAHTIGVANLAEAVCNAIGANALLARVGVYYHDIGKVVKPQYFIENQPRGRNPHDKLKPAMSAAIVRSHVSEGMRLAQEARLPDAVKAFIVEHHGTQQISFFLDQARKADPDAPLNAAEFAYAGPRPRSRETAVAMLCDSCESAARTLNDPTPRRIRELVDRVVDAKIAAGQLDESPLTLREVTTAKETLAKGLTGMYHHRVDYPAPLRSAEGEAGEPARPGAEGAPEPDAPAPPAERGASAAPRR